MRGEEVDVRYETFFKIFGRLVGWTIRAGILVGISLKTLCTDMEDDNSNRVNAGQMVGISVRP